MKQKDWSNLPCVFITVFYTGRKKREHYSLGKSGVSFRHCMRLIKSLERKGIKGIHKLVLE